MLEGLPSREEFVNSFEKVLEFAAKLRDSNTAALKDIRDQVAALGEKLVTDSADDRKAFKDELDTLAQQSFKEQKDALNFLYDKVRALKDGKDGKQGPKGDRGEPGVGKEGPRGTDGSPDTGEDIISKINEAEGLIAAERLDLSEFDKRLTAASTRVQTPAKAFRIYSSDASSQCDGANKTFSVGGSHFGIVGVFSTEFPIIYRPIIDYTETRTGILLTAAVGAPQSGQTLVIQYLK